ncbi:hypothetical protein HanXRQr2_Chr03g0095761 [Helianthus annuus]|uniref:Uncharacterized protein n=1 Tax=Helianthus annuus TaxID=4232 RepID=A0A9K3JCZ7_HELAN|nr:hypothetical protein HanXRQr2_Chr03g0095761 [Helianthus annuus]KAJ0942474.1 hypothetical protein HanPSC8_Chr03g0092361 [Helianthus annuus]
MSRTIRAYQTSPIQCESHWKLLKINIMNYLHHEIPLHWLTSCTNGLHASSNTFTLQKKKKKNLIYNVLMDLLDRNLFGERKNK